MNVRRGRLSQSLVGLVAGVGVAACAGAPDPRPVPPRGPTEPLAYTVAKKLATEVGPRLAGSPGDAKAVGLMVRELQALGFSNVHAELVPVPVWRRVREAASFEAPGRSEPLSVTALGWSVSTPKGGVTAEVIEVTSLEAIASAEVRGKIVFCNVVMARAADGSGYGKTVGVRAGCPKLSEERGAVAALVRSVGTDDTDAPHTGSMRRNNSKIPGAALSVRSAERLHAALAAASPAPLRVTLDVVTETGPDAPSANVVADAPGSDPSARREIVLLGAHLDSWDLGQGAVDDGAGVGVVVAAGRAFVERPSARTVRVVLFAAEESSLAGARAYAEQHRDELASHVAALEIDAGTGRVQDLRVLAGEKVALPTVLGIVPSGEPAEGGADVSPLRAAGVPVLDARQDMSTYFDVHHTRNDVVAALDPLALAQVTNVVTELARFASRPDVRFGRVPEDRRVRK
ncbi:MAG: M28 family peptidase [Polyangiaceae bacterium]